MSDIIKEAREALEGVTPGEWAAGLYGEPTAVAHNGRLVASSGGYSDGNEQTRPENIANARFIAWARQGVPELIARAEAAEAALARAYMAGRDDTAKVADTAMKRHAKAHYSGDAVRVFRNGDDSLSESAAKAYCAGEILESIRAVPVPADLAKRVGVSHE